jgi:hypothetical protein
MRGLTNNLTGRPYYKQKETGQEGNLEATNKGFLSLCRNLIVRIWTQKNSGTNKHQT